MFSTLSRMSDKKFIYFINLLMIVLSISLLRFPIALGLRYNLVYRGLGTFPLIVTLLFDIYVVRKNRYEIKVDKRALLIFTVFVVFWVQGILRTALSGINFDTFYFTQNLVSFIIVGFLAFLAFFAIPESYQQMQLRKGLIYAFGLFITLNLVLFLLGIDPQDPIYLARYPAHMLKLIGIQSYRVLFPMADGINGFGLLAGATLVGHALLLKSQGKILEKVLNISILLVCILVILLTDSRGALLFSILSIALIFLPGKVFAFFRWSPMVVSLLPLIALSFVPGLFSGAPSWMNRPRSEWGDNQIVRVEQPCQDLPANPGGVLSNRPIIWELVIDKLSSFEFIHVIGYGYRGQIVSAISEKYACLFVSYSNSLLASTHNIWLQLILDIGYIGTIFAFVFLAYLIISLTRLISVTGNEEYRGLLGILLYIILIGSLEASISPDFYEIFILILYISLCAMVALPNMTQTRSEKIQSSY